MRRLIVAIVVCICLCAAPTHAELQWCVFKTKWKDGVPTLNKTDEPPPDIYGVSALEWVHSNGHIDALIIAEEAIMAYIIAEMGNVLTYVSTYEEYQE